MRAALTRIGNSRGIRIPKPLITQCGLGDVVELRVTPEGLMISPHRSPRQGWRQAFAASGAEEPAKEGLLLGGTKNAFDREEWRW
jgi:antitoxin MazE